MTDPGSVGATSQSQQQHTTYPNGGNTMTSSNRKPFRLSVESFALFNNDSAVSFEADDDLSIGVSRALGNPTDPAERMRSRLASQAALVLIELGIDGDPSHRVRVQRTGNFPGPGEDRGLYEDAYNYPTRADGGDALILGDAIEACQAILDQLLVMRTADEARAAEHNALSIGEDYGRSQERRDA